jgi:hypothetical protein
MIKFFFYQNQNFEQLMLGSNHWKIENFVWKNTNLAIFEYRVLGDSFEYFERVLEFSKTE